MRIAVATPGGNVGRHVVAMLIRAGLRPLLLARRPERLASAVRAEADVAGVDLYDADGVVAATRGVEALYWVDPTTGSEDPFGDYTRATAAVVRAVAENQIGRTVFQSSVGAELRHGAGEIDGLAATEVALEAAGAAVTHLRCGFFFTNLELQLEAIRAGRIPIILPVDQPMAWVAPRDIAEVAVTRLLSRDWSGRVVQAVHGPADLTWAEAAEIVSAAVGRPVTVEQISDDAMRELLRASGMTAGLTDAVIGMSTGLRDGFVPEQSRTVRTTTPTTLAAWAYDTLRPQLAGH
ncbi:NmrA/HSCARG family protein [Dactylosporangium maewongense]|uniref:NmrA/HSCARG family protein n=1 Tax=Dactylosporangium maewongense TaxID=634393 RepID=A0ABN2D4N4_9ACTN